MEDVRFAGMLAQGFVCRECRLAAPEFARAVAYASYDAEMRRLIRLLKFERVRGVARLMGGRMAEAILKLEGVAANELLVIAVPLFRERERQRGYNQSVLLADAALGHLRKLRPGWKLIPAHRLLERRKSTESSFVLSRKGRRRNLSGAFAVCGGVRGREVLLIDDILTSGATARECARVLMRAGAAKVWVATLARAQKQFVRRQHEDPGEYVAAWDPAPSANNSAA
jgi:ComF family protein